MKAAKHGYARGEETRARIISAAVKLFGEHGFAGASTRDIAAAAGVNAPALQYYFNNKEGVYQACVEHIISHVWEHISPAVTAGQRVLEGPATEEDLIEAFCAIQAQIAELIFTVQEADDWRLFMARQQTGSGPRTAFDTFHQQVNSRLSGVTAGLVARLLGTPAQADETLVRTMALTGQLMVFQVMRRSALRTLQWDAIDSERLGLLKRIIREHTSLLLRALVLQHKDRSA